MLKSPSHAAFSTDKLTNEVTNKSSIKEVILNEKNLSSPHYIKQKKSPFIID